MRFYLLFLFISIFFVSCAIFEPDIYSSSATGSATYTPIGKSSSTKSTSDQSKTKPKKRAVKGVTDEAYTIQVGAFKNIKNAGAVVDTLNNRGLDAFLYKDDNLYKVRFGHYKSLKDAKTSAIALMNKNTIADYYIVKPEEYSSYKSISTGDDGFVRNQLVKTAHAYKGIPYSWGGTSAQSGFDCSGLTRAVYRLNGLDIPRVSVDQFESGNKIKKSELKNGDLVFFATSGSRVNHVGVYIGNNEFIHAPSSGKVVRIDNINDNYWTKHFKGARSYL